MAVMSTVTDRSVEPRLDPADHRAAAAVRDDRDSFARAPVEHVDHVLLAARSHDEVRDVVEAALQVAHDVAKSLAARVGRPDRPGRSSTARPATPAG